MSFHPIDAFVELDRRLTPGPIARWHDAHYGNVRRRAVALNIPDLIAEIDQLKAGEPARLAIAVGAVVELFGIPQVSAEKFPVETLFGLLAAAPVALLLGPHRGTVKLHEREIMEEELNRRRLPDAIG